MSGESCQCVSSLGGPTGEPQSAQHEGLPLPPLGCSEGEARSAQHVHPSGGRVALLQMGRGLAPAWFVLLSVAAHAAALVLLPMAWSPSSPSSTPTSEVSTALRIQLRHVVSPSSLALTPLGAEVPEVVVSSPAVPAAVPTPPPARVPGPEVKPESESGSGPSVALFASAGAGLDSPPLVVTETSTNFDVPPMPVDGWAINAAALLGLPPNAPPLIALIEVDVDMNGVIVEWRLVETNAEVHTTLAVLDGIQNTAMVPARLSGNPVVARFSAELAFTD